MQLFDIKKKNAMQRGFLQLMNLKYDFYDLKNVSLKMINHIKILLFSQKNIFGSHKAASCLLQKLMVQQGFARNYCEFADNYRVFANDYRVFLD